MREKIEKDDGKRSHVGQRDDGEGKRECRRTEQDSRTWFSPTAGGSKSHTNPSNEDEQERRKEQNPNHVNQNEQPTKHDTMKREKGKNIRNNEPGVGHM